MLTRKQQRFVEEYLATWNATRAAEVAGYAHPRQQGSRLLTHVDIAAAIDERLDQAAMAANEILARLSEQARANIFDFVRLTEDGRMVGVNPEEIERRGHLVKKITTSEGKTDSVGIEMYDGQAALIQLGKYRKLFVDRTEHTGKDGGPILVWDWQKTQSE
jgi:phage terminase small subunit